MNIVRIREMPAEMAKVGLYSTKIAAKFQLAPVFVMPYPTQQLTEDEVRWCKENLMGGESNLVPVRLPYAYFILVVELDRMPELEKELGMKVDRNIEMQVTNDPFFRPTGLEDYDDSLLTVIRNQGVGKYNSLWQACVFTGREKRGPGDDANRRNTGFKAIVLGAAPNAVLAQ